jgi:hypothetical protein
MQEIKWLASRSAKHASSFKREEEEGKGTTRGSESASALPSTETPVWKEK